MKKVGIIGCGAIGSELARAIDNGVINAKLIAIYDIIKEKSLKLANTLKSKPKVVDSVEELIALRPDIIVEAASQKAVKEYAEKILKNKINLMIMSVGALLDKDLLKGILDIAKSNRVSIYIPSGAIAGLDAIKSLGIHGIDKVILRTRKNPKALENSPYIISKNVDLSNIKHETVIYRGKAIEAVKAFPANINVSATLSLASNIDVEIIADPNVNRNIHEIEVYSNASKLIIKVENIPSPSNPKTSYLAVLAAIRTLKEICEESGLFIK